MHRVMNGSAIVAALALMMVMDVSGSQVTTATLTLRGHPQTLHLYGPPTGEPVVVTSGDGGWIHLAPHVAETLAARGFYVVGLDAKAYLESFTTSRGTLDARDEPGDFKALAAFAGRASSQKPVLIGVSEGAGLSVLAATDPATRDAIAGVIGLGLPNLNELGWRWKDALIYITHGVPNEPTFSTLQIVSQVSPLPLAAIHSTHDEFVPVGEIQKVIDAAREPKRLWLVDAADHGFSNRLAEFDQRLVEALGWVRAQARR
jgi:fermentation-respiration switch protein FrsA (DUF1100 family)